MLIEFDHAKSDKNLRERGLSFERVDEFDFETAVYLIDDRHDYVAKVAGLRLVILTGDSIFCALCIFPTASG